MADSVSARRVPIRVVQLEDRTNPDSTFYQLLTTQHVDLSFNYAASEWTTGPIANNTAEYSTDQALLYVHPSASVNRPAGSQWDFLGVSAGSPVFVAPQTQNPSLIFLGASSEATVDEFAAYNETDTRVTTSIPFAWMTVQLNAVRGPGQFSVWTNNVSGTPTVWMSSSLSGIDGSDKFFLLEGGHAHFNWGFTAAGRYEIDLQATGYLGPGKSNPTSSPISTFYFQVSDQLKVTSIVPTESGFIAQFNRPIETNNLNLFDTASGSLGLPDITLTGASTGQVRGSLVIPRANVPNISTGLPTWTNAINAVEFVRNGGPLLPDTYTLTLRAETGSFSTNKGFKTATTPVSTSLLDGNSNGITGDSHTGTFSVSSTSARTLSIPDFVRGFNQQVNVPAQATGIPIVIDNAAGLTSITLDLEYDASLLNVTDAVLANSLPLDYTITKDFTVAGRARITIDGTTPLASGAQQLLHFVADVPATAPYAAKQVLRLTNLSINTGTIPVRADRSVHVAAFLGDTTGSRGYSGLDASNILRVVNNIDSGFVAYQNADPLLIADTNSDGVLTSADATALAQKSVGNPILTIPDLPAVGNPVAGGPDPRIFIPTTMTAAVNATVTIPVRMEVTEPAGVSFRAVDLAVSFDPVKFTASNVRLSGTVISGFNLSSTTDNLTGQIRVTAYTTTDQFFANATLSDLVLFDLTVKPTSPLGASPLNVRANSGTTLTSMNEGQLTLSPAPTNNSNDVNVDGTLTVLTASTVPAVTSIGVNVLGVAAAAESANVVTITTNAPHGFRVGETITLSGVGTGYDGSFVVSTVLDHLNFQYSITTGPLGASSPGGTVSGAMWSGQQRSRVTSIMLTFNTAIDTAFLNGFSGDAFKLTQENTGFAPHTLRYDPALSGSEGVNVHVVSSTRLMLSFDSAIAGVNNGSIADGAWKLIVNKNAIRSLGGTFMAADRNTAGNDNLVNTADSNELEINRLFGDVTGDGLVDTADDTQFGPTFGSATGDTVYSMAFDWNADGLIDTADDTQLGPRFGSSWL